MMNRMRAVMDSMTRRRLVHRTSQLVLLAGVLMTAPACAVLVVPDPTQSGQVDMAARMVSKEADGISVTVQSMAWQYNPYFLDDYFTPLFLLIRNGNDEPLELQYGQFVLIDDRGNQFNVVPPQTVDLALKGRGVSYPYVGPYYYAPPVFHPFYGLDPYNFHYADIVLIGLQETTILPHAQVRGFLYFQRATFEGQRFTLSVALGDAPPQEFHFTVQR